MIKVEVLSLSKQRESELGKEVQRIMRKVLRFLKKEDVSVEVYLADNRKMKQLNKKFKNKNKAADVLSFAEPKNWPHPKGEKFLGEIYLNISRAKNQGLPGLLIHGLLHLLGYAHGKNSDRIKMERKAERLLKLVNGKW